MPTETGLELPFDVMAAIYGVILGLAAVLVGLIILRAVSERTPSTESEDRVLRESRISLRQESSSEKIEVPCPSCQQRLKIPVSHSGMVKCPACSSQFHTSPPEETKKTQENPPSQPGPELATQSETTPSINTVISSDDELLCPECQQMLRIPIDRRPAHSRCPACRTEFLAEVG